MTPGPGRVLNLGVLAHVDAGKTSLTERLLYETGTISAVGSVDAGTTQTDTGAIERRRGITIRAAVAAFDVAGRQYNLVDTPGHTDFAAEVERALSVLDAVVLVVNAVRGVQPQTRALMRIVDRTGLPVVVFVNKIDSVGARGTQLLGELQQRLGLRALAVATATGIGTPAAASAPADLSDPATARRWHEVLAESDEDLLRCFVDDEAAGPDRLRQALRDQTAGGQLRPVVFGSAITGAGIPALLDVLSELPPPQPTGEGLQARVFAVDRGPGGEKTVVVRAFSGTLINREQVEVHPADGATSTGRVRGIDVVVPGGHDQRPLTAGHIARVRGLTDLRIGDDLGTAGGHRPVQRFPRPGLQAVVRPRDPARAGELHAALLRLADQDPLIQTTVNPDGDSTVSLYGEVQREVLQQTLTDTYRIEVDFDSPTVLHIERPVGTGSAVEIIGHGFLATVGVRVEPGAGITYRREVELGSMAVAFHDAVEETVHRSLRQGIHGWPVHDITVTMTHSGFWPRPYSAAGDYRDATPHVLHQALARAGTRVYEPLHRFWVEVGADSLGAVTAHLAQHEARIEDTAQSGHTWTIEGHLPLRRVNEVQLRLPTLTNGEAAWASQPDGDTPVTTDPPPSRPRTDGNPADRDAYLRYLSQRG